MITGSCLCGEVKFAIDGEFTEASICHCSICRRATGSASGAYGGVRLAHFKWTQGEDQLSEFSATDLLKKYFCKICGSTLVSLHLSWPEYAYISLGCLEGGPKLSIDYHQFVASKAGWETIPAGVKQFKEWPVDES